MAPFNSSIIKLKESAIIENKNTDISNKTAMFKMSVYVGTDICGSKSMPTM